MKGLHRDHRALSALILSVALLAGCESSATQEDVGTVVGGVVGGLLGSAVGKGGGKAAAIVGGAVLGAMIGRSIGRYMDDSDRRRMGEVLDTTPTGQTAEWRNPDTGYDFKMTPVRDYQSADGHPCREFVQQVIVDGELKSVDGSACKEPDAAVWTSS